MAETNNNTYETTMVVYKDPRGFFRIKQESGKGSVPKELAGKAWTMEKEADKALIAYLARKEASKESNTSED